MQQYSIWGCPLESTANVHIGYFVSNAYFIRNEEEYMCREID